MLSSLMFIVLACTEEAPKGCDPSGDWSDWPDYVDGHQFLGHAWCAEDGVDREFDLASFEALGLAAAGVESDTIDAMAEWNALANPPTFAVASTDFSSPVSDTLRTDDPVGTTTPAHSYDGFNVLVAANDLDPGWIGRVAVTKSWFDESNANQETDVVVYRYSLRNDGVVEETDWAVASAPGAGQADFLYNQVHEFGHVLGLDHSTYDASIMFDDQPDGVEYPGLAPGDIAAVEWLYSG